MIVVLLVTAVTLLTLFVYICKGTSRARKLPNGVFHAPLERGWPILGILPQIEKPLYKYFMELVKKHGALFKVQFGMRKIFILNSYDVFKKCFKDDADNFSGRWNGKLVKVFNENSGIMFIDGEKWAKQRSFILRVFRDFGLGRSKMVEMVQEECRYLLEEIDQLVDTSVDFSEMIPIYTCNIISKFIMRKRYKREDYEVKFISKIVNKLIKQEDKLLTFVLLFPFWDKSEMLSKFIFYLSSRSKDHKEIYEIFQKEITNHLQSLDLNSEGDDLMDRFLIEQHKIKSKRGSVEDFTDFQLIRVSLELFIAGFETTSTTLGWSLLFLSKYPEIQLQMHAEIVGSIGSECLQSMNDRKSLPLTQAIMDEILRLSTVTPLSIYHRNFNDTVIDGIFIPGDSLIFQNIYACHRDPDIWQKPFEFNPQHFLSSDSEGVLKYTPREELIAFGMGKRQCLGESLARAKFFIFLVSIIQRFRVRFANNISEKDYEEALIGNEGGIRFSSIKDFIFDKWD